MCNPLGKVANVEIIPWIYTYLWLQNGVYSSITVVTLHGASHKVVFFKNAILCFVSIFDTTNDYEQYLGLFYWYCWLNFFFDFLTMAANGK